MSNADKDTECMLDSIRFYDQCCFVTGNAVFIKTSFPLKLDRLKYISHICAYRSKLKFKVLHRVPHQV